MQSIESNALEPTRAELSAMSFGQKIQRLLPVYGLVILTVFLILLFSILLPQTFPTMLNLRSIISDKTIIAILSLAAMIPMAAGRIDLTIGYGIVLWHVLAISLQKTARTKSKLERGRETDTSSSAHSAAKTCCQQAAQTRMAHSTGNTTTACAFRQASDTPARTRAKAQSRKAERKPGQDWPGPQTRRPRPPSESTNSKH